jgi:hypothetical protein
MSPSKFLQSPALTSATPRSTRAGAAKGAPTPRSTRGGAGGSGGSVDAPGRSPRSVAAKVSCVVLSDAVL